MFSVNLPSFQYGLELYKKEKKKPAFSVFQKRNKIIVPCPYEIVYEDQVL